jgi:SpoVK/Ycf46/Vps4 family AAA+-type ATPase
MDKPPNDPINLLLARPPAFSLENIGGLPLVKERLIEEIEFLKIYMNERLSIPYNGKLLFTGPPGTGKTMCAQVFAREMGWLYYELNISAIISQYLGETSTHMHAAFEKIIEIAKDEKEKGKGVVLHIDEFDSIGKSRMADDLGEMKRLVNEILKIFEDIKFSETGIIIIASTNHHGLLDNAVWSRFDMILDFALPDEAARSEILDVLLKTYEKADLTFLEPREVFIHALATSTPDFSGRDLRSLMQYLVKKAITKHDKKLTLDEAKKALDEKILTPSADHEQYKEAGNKDDKQYTIFHGELNVYKYKDLMQSFFTTDHALDAYLDLARAFLKLPKNIREQMKEVDFAFLHVDEPLKFLESLKNERRI